MPGQRQQREAAYCYDGDGVHVATARLEQFMDGSGRWVVLLNSPPQMQRPRVWVRPGEDAAREVLAAIYTEGETKGGTWDVIRPEPY